MSTEVDNSALYNEAVPIEFTRALLAQARVYKRDVGAILRAAKFPFDPLAQDVQRNAVGSAMRDPRFPPVSLRELDGLQIELSILTPPQALDFSGPDDLLAKLRPGVDGVIIDKNWRRATLLPSVWENIPDPIEFMSILCRKAGLPDREWRRPGMTVYVYQAEKVAEN